MVVADTQEVDVQQVMERIRESIRRRRSVEATTEPLSASDNGSGSLDVGHLQSVGDLSTVAVPSHRRVLGPVIVAIKKILLKLLTPLLERQAAYNAAATRAMADTDNRMRAMEWRQAQALARSEEQLGASIAEVGARLQDEVTRLRGDLFSRIVEDVDARHAALREEVMAAVSALREELAAQSRAMESAAGDVDARVTERTERLKEQFSASERRWRRLIHVLQDGAPREGGSDATPPADRPTLPPAALEPAFDYAGFEERFRGAETDIKERQRIYVPVFDAASSLVDLGCGRGEFLELLREHGIPAQGVDLDLDMVLLCRDKGLDVVREDAFAHLAARADDSVGGIFSAQFIEHLPPGRIVDLVKLCHRKLAPGGCVVLETPNPACLMVFADSFYRDFSHVQPIHSDTMKFLLEAAGFRDVEVKALAPVDPAVRVPPLPGDDPALVLFNQGIERLNALLFGFQDYAVVGRKGWARAGQAAPGPDA
jgi:SAM-dependent methyltransferase/molybdopterin converting factor small subunit